MQRCFPGLRWSTAALGFALLIGSSSWAGGQELEKAANALVFQKGKGEPRLVHPTGKSKVAEGKLIDANGKELATLTERRVETVACYSFSPDGRFLAVGIRYDSASGGKDGTIRGYVRIYDAVTGTLLRDSGAPIIGPVTHIGFSAKGSELQFETGKYVEVGGK